MKKEHPHKRFTQSFCSKVEFENLDFKKLCEGLKEVVARKNCGCEVDIITSGRHALGFEVEVQRKGVCNKNLPTTLLIRQLKKQGRRLSEGGNQVKRQRYLLREHFI